MAERPRPTPPTFGAATPLPGREDIDRLWDEHGMLDNIRAHSRVVCQVALLLTDWLAAGGVRLHRPAVEAGALLHDLAKTPCLGTRRWHDREGRDLVTAAGYPELGWIVRWHVMLPADQPLDEILVVNYADKRVKHDRVVTLDERFAYIAERYARGKPGLLELIAQGRERAYEVERRIFSAAGFDHTPAEIARRVEASGDRSPIR